MAQRYADPEDLTRLAIRPAALNGIPQEAIEAALLGASRLADSYLQTRYTLPLVTWGDDLRRAVAIIAAYDLLTARGYAPEGPEDQVRLRYEDVLAWLRDVAKGLVTPTGLVDSSPAPDTAPPQPAIATERRRW